MGFYENTAATVNRLLTKFGAPVTLSRSTSTYNTATGSSGTPTTVSYVGVGVKLEYKQTDYANALIRQGDQRVYMSTVGIVTPQTGDVLTIAGTDFQVIASRPLQPALTAVLHDVQIRGVA